VFTVIRPGAALAVLICEDLARFDPVLPVINAVGPNLVISLLLMTTTDEPLAGSLRHRTGR